MEQTTDAVTLTPDEWRRLLELFRSDRGWSETEVLEAITDGGWMHRQDTEEAEE